MVIFFFWPNNHNFEIQMVNSNLTLEKLPRILLETKRQKNPKISMTKTHTFLEKLAPKFVNRKDESINWSTLLTRLQNPQTDHIISRGDENEQKLIRSRRREKMRGRAQEWNREREADTWWEALVLLSYRREKKKEKKDVFILYKDNIKIRDK